eukprot:11990200-Alexandrium_andersonii.AAC.1
MRFVPVFTRQFAQRPHFLAEHVRSTAQSSCQFREVNVGQRANFLPSDRSRYVILRREQTATAAAGEVWAFAKIY